MSTAKESDLRKRLAAREPKILTTIGEESKGKSTNALTSRQISRIIKKERSRK